MADEDGLSYKYYIFEDLIPVKVTFNKNGHKLAAEVPDAETRQLVLRTPLLGRMDHGFFDEMDKATFDKLCEEEYAKNRSASSPPQSRRIP
jgi:hypothetical protein